MRVHGAILLVCLILSLLNLEPSVFAQGGGGGGAGRGGGNRPGGAAGGGPAGLRGSATADQQASQYRQILEINDASQWSLLLPLITDVISARNFMPSPNQRGAVAGRGGLPADGRGGPGGAGGRGAGPVVDPDLGALEVALARNASTEELKAALDKANESARSKVENLLKAQAELRKVLTVRQEAILVVNGLLLPTR